MFHSFKFWIDIPDLRQVQCATFRNLRLVQHLLWQVRADDDRQADPSRTVHLLGLVHQKELAGGFYEATLLRKLFSLFSWQVHFLFQLHFMALNFHSAWTCSVRTGVVNSPWTQFLWRNELEPLQTGCPHIWDTPKLTILTFKNLWKKQKLWQQL